ncbi:MAG: ABC transporter permease [Acidobacteriota bacterium]
MLDWKDEIRRRLAGLKLEPAREIEIVEELSQHLDDRYAELLAGGATEEQADRALFEELSQSEVLARELKRVELEIRNAPVVLGARRRDMVGDLWQDSRYAVRMATKNRGFTLVAVLSLALGIGANAAIFQLLDAVLLRTLPVSRPQELAEVRLEDMEGARGSFNTWNPSLSNPIWEQIRNQQQAFSGIVAWNSTVFNLAPGGEPRLAQGLWVSGDFFNVLGVRPILGRVLMGEDDQRGCGSPVAVISNSFWQREYGGDPSVIGRELTLAGRTVEIIGVTPASFFGLEVGKSFDIALPLCSEALLLGKNSQLESGTTWWLTIIGRLKPGWSMEQATASLKSISPGLFEATLPANYPSVSVNQYLGFRLAAYPAGSGISQVRETYSSPLWLLLAIAGMVLLIACANLANLMLARASAREREIAIRLAIGASRGRLIRQLMAESLLLAVVGAGLGLLLARELSRFLVSFLSTEGNTLFVDLDVDWRVLAFTAGVAILTCIVFGLTPAIRATRIAPAAVLKAGSRGMTASREGFSLRRALVALQVALSLVLLVSALLFSRSLGKLLTEDTGFKPSGILLVGVSLRPLNLPGERRQGFKEEVLDRIRAIPGVGSAADTNVVPLSGNSWGNDVWADGSDSGQRTNSNFSRVSPDYFKTLGITLLTGRDFDQRDTATSPAVAIVNETFARRLLNDANPIGMRFWREATPGESETVYEIVGLVKDTKYQDLRRDFPPIAYLAVSQGQFESQFEQVLIRSNSAASDLVSPVKAAVEEINPKIGVDFEVMETGIWESLLRERLMATLSGFFGFLAALLAAIGLYGVISYGVAGRTREIGIRMALGAERRDVLWLILREALMLVLIGVAVGLPAVLAATRFVSSLLFGLEPADPVALSGAVLLMLLVAAVAGYIPARRATKVDPMVALRCE